MDKKDVVIASLEWVVKRSMTVATTTGSQLIEHLIENKLIDTGMREIKNLLSVCILRSPTLPNKTS